MANKAAGEVELTLDGKTYTLRPSFAAIVEFEERSGVSLFEALRALGERQSVQFKHITAAFYAGIRAGWKHNGRPPTFEEIGASIYRDGLGNHLASYMEFLGNAMTGEKALKQAAEAVEQGKVQTPAT